MKSLTELAVDLCADPEHPERPGNHMNEATWDFIEALTFADADTIMVMIREIIPDLTGDLPVWARNLAFRLACLQRPDDAELLRAAAADLYFHGPDWDEHAEKLLRRADQLDGSSPT
ncbi:hypothetical protein [Micromonospora sp. NPDC049497]|uniref:hypothetical protein n=1 Tax=Micromonospora sp. NPDC049497 TaxID=3364273 RepID=UPI003799B21D